MKFRVERDDLADAVAWVAQEPAHPSVRCRCWAACCSRRSAADGTLTVSGFDYEVSGQVERRARRSATPAAGVLVSGRLLAEITQALPAKPVDIAVDGSRVTIVCGSARFTPADHAGRGLPGAAGHAAARRHGRRPTVRRGRRPGRGGRRPGRHAADADRRPAGDRRVDAHPGRHRPVPAGGARAGLDAGGRRAEHRGAGAGPHAGRRRQDARRLRRPSARPSRRRRHARLLRRRPAGATTRLLDAEFPQVPLALPGRAHHARASAQVAALAEAIKRVALVTDRGHAGAAGVRRRTGSRLAAGGDDEGRAEEELQLRVRRRAAD